MTVFYIITKFICFPGAYLRGFWEHLTCRLIGLQIEPVGYIRIDEASGHCEHSLPSTQFAAYLMATGPGFMNFHIGLYLFLFGFMNIEYMGITPWDNLPLFIVYIISMYLGISCLNCVFPLSEDILNYWFIAYGPSGKHRKGLGSVADAIGRILGFPIAAVTRLGAFLEKYGVIFILWVVYLIWEFVFT